MPKMCEVATRDVEDQNDLLYKGKNMRRANGTTHGIVGTRFVHVQTITCPHIKSILEKRLSTITTTKVVLEGEPFFPMCHLNLLLNTIHNNDDMHYYIIIKIFIYAYPSLVTSYVIPSLVNAHNTKNIIYNMCVECIFQK